jgi:uncharacterized membrane protein YsdA (DUF1294 family)
VYALDKNRAKTNNYRIPEQTLLLLASFGGALGAYLSMNIFRHKTQHKKFTYAVPVMLILQVALLLCFAFG